MIKFTVHKANLINVSADAIVNSVNHRLIKGSGMSKAVFEVAGEDNLLKELSKYGGNLDDGQAVVTKGYNLPSRYIIHTVVPSYYIERAGKVANFSMCFVNVLALANEKKVKTLAVPCLGAGINGWPLEEAVSICLDTLMWTLQNHGEYSIKHIMLIAYDDKVYECFKKELRKRRDDYNIEI